MAQDRRHHYVPAFYLAQFTDTRSQEGDLWVFDGKQLRSWPSTPRGAGHEKDFNRIEVPDVDPLAVEKEIFGTIESLAAPVVKSWCSRADGALALGMPGFRSTIEELSGIFTFIATQWIRVPAMRESLDQFHTAIARRLVAQTSSSEETFARAQANGEHLRALTREGLRAFVEDPSFRMKSDAAGYFRSLLPTISLIVDLLGTRQWGIIYGPSSGPNFICSDDPVLLLPPGAAHPFFGTGFGTPGSMVCVPISSRHALCGIEPDPGRRPQLDVAVIAESARAVATLNRNTILHAHRFLYGGSDTFAWLRDDNEIGDFQDLKDAHEKAARKRERGET